MEISGTVPLVVHRKPAGRHRVLVVAAALAAVAGVVVIVSSLILAAGSTGADRWRQSGTGLLGVASVIYGTRRIVAYRGLLSREAVLRLDETGVSLRNGTVRNKSWARLSWGDVAHVETRSTRVGPPIYRDDLDVTVLRFVAIDDDAVSVDALQTFDRVKAAGLGLTPAGGCIAMVLMSPRHERIALVRNWLAAHRPDVRFVEH